MQKGNGSQQYQYFLQPNTLVITNTKIFSLAYQLLIPIFSLVDIWSMYWSKISTKPINVLHTQTKLSNEQQEQDEQTPNKMNTSQDICKYLPKTQTTLTASVIVSTHVTSLLFAKYIVLHPLLPPSSAAKLNRGDNSLFPVASAAWQLSTLSVGLWVDISGWTYIRPVIYFSFCISLFLTNR